MTETWTVEQVQQLSVPVNGGAFQGIATDGVCWYCNWTSTLQKYDRNWNLLIEIDNPADLVGVDGLGTGHFSGSCVINSFWYIPLASWPHDPAANPYMTAWNTADLSLAGVIGPLDDNGSGSVCWDAVSNRFLIAPYYATTGQDTAAMLQQYDQNFTYLGPLNLSSEVGEKQGVTIFRDQIYFSSTIDGNGVWRCNFDGTGVEKLPFDAIGSEIEDLDTDGESLLVIWRSPNTLWKYTPIETSTPLPVVSGPPQLLYKRASYTGPTRYSVLVSDIVTDAPVGVLPVTSLNFQRRISAAGSLSASVPLSSAQLGQTLSTLTTMRDRPCAISVTRQVTGYAPELWWYGCAWSVQPAHAPGSLPTVTISATTIDSFTSKRKLWSDATYTGQDSATVFRSLWSKLQGAPNGNLNVELPTTDMVGDSIDQTFHSYDDLSFDKLLATLCNGLFEWTIDCYYDSDGNPRRVLRLGAPRLGVSGAQHLLTEPGNIISWTFPGDLTRFATRYRARGNSIDVNAGGNVGTEQIPTISPIIEQDTWIDAGFPRIDVSEDYETTSVTALNSYAERMKTAALNGASVPTVTVRLSKTNLSLNSLGDDVRVTILDPWTNYQPTTAVYRLVGMTVTAPDTAALELLPKGQAEAAEGAS